MDDIDRDIDQKERGRFFSRARQRIPLDYCGQCGEAIYRIDPKTGEPYQICWKCTWLPSKPSVL